MEVLMQNEGKSATTTIPDVGRTMALGWLSEHGTRLVEAAPSGERGELRRAIDKVKLALAGEASR